MYPIESLGGIPSCIDFNTGLETNNEEAVTLFIPKEQWMGPQREGK